MFLFSGPYLRIQGSLYSLTWLRFLFESPLPIIYVLYTAEMRRRIEIIACIRPFVASLLLIEVAAVPPLTPLHTGKEEALGNDESLIPVATSEGRIFVLEFTYVRLCRRQKEDHTNEALVFFCYVGELGSSCF